MRMVDRIPGPAATGPLPKRWAPVVRGRRAPTQELNQRPGGPKAAPAGADHGDGACELSTHRLDKNHAHHIEVVVVAAGGSRLIVHTCRCGGDLIRCARVPETGAMRWLSGMVVPRRVRSRRGVERKRLYSVKLRCRSPLAR